MDLIRRVIRKSIILILPLALLSFVVDWKSRYLKFAGLFGNPHLIPLSIIIGAILGIANSKGLVRGIESLLGTYKANTKLLFFSILRLFILFTVIIVLTALRVINLLGLVAGMTVVLIILIVETARLARSQEKNEDEL